MAFHRAFDRYSGGHGKVWDYFGHVRAHGDWDATVFLAPGSVAEDNPWLASGCDVQDSWRPEAADALFLAGMDWDAVATDQPNRPVLNLIQGVRHDDPALPLRAFLQRPAIRICVGAPVAEAIRATGLVRGPVLTIEAGIELPGAPALRGQGVFIAGHKQPGLARALHDHLQALGVPVDLAIDWRARDEFRQRLSAAEVVVALPLAREGFFLPALESMALGKPTIVPDCEGNRAYARPGINVLSPEMSVAGLAAAVDGVLGDPELRQALAANGIATARKFGLQRERRALHDVLDNLDGLWAGAWAATSH